MLLTMFKRFLLPSEYTARSTDVPALLLIPRSLETTQASQPLTHYVARVPVYARPTTPLFLKRLVDVSAASLALVLLSPLLLLISIAIKMTSRGPIFFTQTRVGLGGLTFKLYKFRSMVQDADALKDSLESENEKDGPIFKMKHDPRITSVGRFLRKYSLDELPQLLNVLKNDMSLVGPRPPVPREVVQYEDWQLRRLSVQPGLTCIWQTSGRSKLTFDEWVRMDLQYIDDWNLSLDLKLLLKTVKVVITADGAY